ncbi:MAG: hydantoinase/oxoprolinase family protein [Candidatus Acidiferrales bacterium]
MSFRVAIDVGGTFTDLVAYDESSRRLVIAKESTTPSEFSVGVLNALTKSAIPPQRVNRFANGSTIVINALTERKGVRTALFSTRGFRDVLEIQRSNRPDIYNFNYAKPKPFLPRGLTFEVPERMDAQGRVVEELRLEDLAEQIRRCQEKKVEAIGVCFFNAYSNGKHEQECADWIRSHWPDVFVCCSHELTQQYREYERASTTVLNAYVQPVVARYLDNLERGLRDRGVEGPLYSMASNGGVMSFSQAKEAPIQVVESGPVAGVIGALVVGNLIDEPNLLTLDVGGTTAKTTLIDKGQVRINTDYFIEKSTTFAGYPLKVPSLDIVEIGAGGGSIFNEDESGALHVGPRSAGAVPGPASYGRGGTEPTLTDAFLLTGVLNPNYFLGGEIALDVSRALAAYGSVARKLGMSVQKLAQGTVRLANSQIINALKLVSVKRGYDPRDFTLVAFGGGGPLHAASVARQLGIRKVLIPFLPGVFSAWGMLLAHLRRDFLRTQLMPVDGECLNRLRRIFSELAEKAQRLFAAEGYDQKLRLEMYVDARYQGQEHSVKVPLGSAPLNSSTISILCRRFGDLHRRAYEFTLSDPIEIVNCHLVGFAKLPKPTLKPMANGKPHFRPRPKGFRSMYLEEKKGMVPVFERSDLLPGTRLTGPIIIEEATSTTIVNPRDRLQIDDYGNMLIQIGA